MKIKNLKKFIGLTLAGVTASAALATGVGVLFNQNAEDLSNAGASETTGVPSIAITELSADPIPVEFASLDTSLPDKVVRDTSDVFEFVELHNYNDGAFDLNGYKLQIKNGSKTYVNEFYFEEGNDGIIESGETFVIFNFSASSFKYGVNDEYSMNYDTAENLAKAWDTFNAFYGVEIPTENRALSLVCDTEGNAISGASNLPERTDVTVSIVNKTTGGSAASVKYTISTTGMSHNFTCNNVYGIGDFLCVNGVSPYKLLREQDPTYVAPTTFTGDKLRVISYNLLYNGYSMPSRMSCFVDFLTTYNPDIMALQEIAIDWYNYLNTILPELGYSYIQVKVQTGGGTVPTYHSDSSNPIIYKTDKFDFVSTDTAFVSEDGTPNGKKWDSVNRARTIAYATLREKETGKIINVLSTHGILTGNQAKFEQMNLAKKIMKNLSETYGGKTILMGDMNYDEGGRYYQNVVSGTGYADAKYLAKNYTYRVTAAHFGKYPYGAVNNPWDDQSSIIDFVFVEEGTQVETYKVIDQEYYNNGEVVHISDHSAVLVDLYI